MRSKENIPSFFSGVFVTLLLIGMILPASAVSSAERVISVFTDVKVYVNDAPIDAGALNGNPEAFICNGTTYIPVRAVSNSLGQDVKWDGNSRSVYVGKHQGSASYLLNVCKAQFISPRRTFFANIQETGVTAFLSQFD